MESVDHIINAQWIITCEETNKILRNHSLIIKNGLIKDIIQSDLVKERYSSSSIHNYSSHALIPGLINTHTHLGMTYLRGIADDLSLHTWLTQYIWPTEKIFLGNQFVYDGTLFAIAELIRSGTTCFNEMFFFMSDTAKAVETAGMRCNIGIHFINAETSFAKDFNEEWSKGLKFLEQYQNYHPLIGLTVAAHSIYMVPEEPLIKVKELAEKHNLKIYMHVNETENEVLESIAKTGLTPLQRLQKMGLMTERLIAVHMTQINEEDLEILRLGKPNIVHCPSSNMKLSSGICPVETLRNLGLNVSIGTDGAASNNDLNMLSEMRMASFLAKVSTRNPVSLSAETVLQMATINGAKALGIDHITGSLTPGKAADVIAINFDHLETLPLYQPISAIVYAASRNQIDHVWVAGKQLMKNRQLTTLDEDEIVAKAKEWGNKIKLSPHLNI